jgi:hypothetical protein
VAFGDLTTLADVKVWLQTGQAAFPATDDALLTRLVTAASQYIQTWLNRGIASADFLEVRDGTGGHRLQFACYPATAVLSLTIDGQAVPAASFNAAGYRFSLHSFRFAATDSIAGPRTLSLRIRPGIRLLRPKSRRHASSSSRCATGSVHASARSLDLWAAQKPPRMGKKI